MVGENACTCVKPYFSCGQLRPSAVREASVMLLQPDTHTVCSLRQPRHKLTKPSSVICYKIDSQIFALAHYCCLFITLIRMCCNKIKKNSMIFCHIHLKLLIVIFFYIKHIITQYTQKPCNQH